MFVEPEDLNARVQDFQKRIRYWISVRRKELKISKNRLARLSGLTKQGLTYLLEGDREPRLRSLIAIATALDLDVLDLLAPIPEGAREADPGDDGEDD